MRKIVFLLEERSMEALLKELLPRIFPEVIFQYIPHEGKQDLEKSIPRKLRAWREPGVHFVVMRDSDGQNCVVLKARLKQLCEQGGRNDTLVRIVCQELEAWYLGDLYALAEAYGNERINDIGRRPGFREPDAIQQPYERIREIVPQFQKMDGARRMANVMSRERNRSPSFQAFIAGIERLVERDK